LPIRLQISIIIYTSLKVCFWFCVLDLDLNLDWFGCVCEFF
jgi:hypothetical protein